MLQSVVLDFIIKYRLLKLLYTEFRKSGILLKLGGIYSKVKNEYNEYIHLKWNDKRNIAFILMLYDIAN